MVVVVSFGLMPFEECNEILKMFFRYYKRKYGKIVFISNVKIIEADKMANIDK